MQKMLRDIKKCHCNKLTEYNLHVIKGYVYLSRQQQCEIFTLLKQLTSHTCR